MIPPEKKAAEIERRYNEVISRLGGGTPAPSTPAPSLPPARSEAAPLAPAPATPAAQAAPQGLREGQRIRQGGVTYQVRNGQLVQVQ